MEFANVRKKIKIKKMIIPQILTELKKNSDTKNIEQMARFGIFPKKTFGVKMPILRKLAKKIGKNHDLAQDLWKKGFRETQILASIIDEPEKVTLKQIKNWISDFDYWEICDQCVMNLFEKIPFIWDECINFANDEREFFRRTGFVIMARLAVSDKKASDKKFIAFFPLIKKFSTDERNMVKKAVNWALRQIGKRNLALHKEALKIAQEISQINNKTAKWISSDAIRELKNEKIISRIKK